MALADDTQESLAKEWATQHSSGAESQASLAKEYAQQQSSTGRPRQSEFAGPAVAPQPTEAPPSPAQQRAVESHTGSPLNLAGQGTAGKAQASMWQFGDYLRNKDLQSPGLSIPTGPFGTINPRRIAESASDIGADITGLVGTATSSAKNAALTAGANIPGVRALLAPYFVYQGAKMMAQGKQPQEDEADYWQRMLLGGSMATGGAAQVGKSTVTTTTNVRNYINRARSLSAVNNASIGLLQGRIAPLAERVDGVMESRVAQRAQVMEQQDKILQQQRGGRPGRVHVGTNQVPGTATITPTELATAHANVINTAVDSAAARNLVQVAGEHVGIGTTFEEGRELRTALGKTASALERAKNGKDAGVLWQLYNALSTDMENHATGPLNMPRQWDAYNRDAVARFDMHKGTMGNLFDTKQYSKQHPIVRLYTRGETPAIGLINDLGGKEPPTGEIDLWKKNMNKLGMNPEELTQVLDDAKRLSQAHDSFTGKGQMGGMWKIASSGGPMATLALGIYGLAHGLGIYGFLPYLMAVGGTAGASQLGAKMAAGGTIADLNNSLPPEAFMVGRTISDEPLPFATQMPGGATPPTAPATPTPTTAGGGGPQTGPTAPTGGGTGQAPQGAPPYTGPNRRTATEEDWQEQERRRPTGRSYATEPEPQSEKEAKDVAAAKAKEATTKKVMESKADVASKVNEARKQRSVYKGRRGGTK